MSRLLRNVLLVLLAGLVMLPSLDPGAGAKREKGKRKQSRPNILIIMTDDQRVDMIDAMPKTLRWFRRQGTEYPNTFVSTPLCCPSRASIMTGRYVHNHGVRNNSESALIDERQTVQRYLKESGYLTGIAGKFLNGWKLRRDPAYFNRFTIMNGGYRRRPYNVDGKHRKIKKYSTDFLKKQTLEYLEFFERRDHKPWLMFVHPFAPHDPYKPVKRHRTAPVPPWTPSPGVTEADRTDKPDVVQNYEFPQEAANWIRGRQLRTLMAVDEMVKAIFKRMGKLKERNKTLAVFTSDNGFFWGEHGLIDKRFPYTESVQVPMFLRWPGRLPGMAQDHRLAMTIDIMPTVMQAAGVPASPEYPIDGRSLLLPGGRDRVLIEHFVDPLHTGIPDWASIRTRTYQYVEYYDDPSQETIGFREYYDLVDDPWQLENLLEDDDETDPPPADLTEASFQLERDRECRGTSGPGACP